MRSINRNIKKRKHEWKLNGIVICKECGAKMTMKVEYKKNSANEIKSKNICCLNGLKIYKGRECIRKSKGIKEKMLNDIIYKNIEETLKRIINKEILKSLIIKKIYNSTYKKYEIKELLKELKKIEEDIKELYIDYKNDLLEKEDYKKFQKEKINQKYLLKKQIKILEIQHKNIFNEEKIINIIEDLLNMRGIEKDIIIEIINNIQIDIENNIYIMYKYNIFEKL